jgi:hypothetical protein
MESDPPKGLYANPQEALKVIVANYEYWTGRLTETSVQMAYAVIGANWIIFGSVNGILSNIWAKLSLLCALLSLAAGVIGAWFLCEALGRRGNFGDDYPEKWEKEYGDFIKRKTTQPKHDPWPITKFIELTSAWSRNLKAAFVLLGALLLIVGTIVK